MNTDDILDENEYFYATRDRFPVTELHTLLIPSRHIESYFELNSEEINAFNSLLFSQKEKILKLKKS